MCVGAPILDIEVVKTILTVVESLAVVGSILFVGFQLRETRRITAGNGYQAWLDGMTQFFMSLAQDPKLADLYWRGRNNLEDLKKEEVPRFFYLCVTYFALIEDLYVQNRQGLIPNEVFLPWQHGFQENLTGSGFTEYWKLEASHFAPVFREYVENLISSAEDGDDKINAFYEISSPPEIRK